MAAEQRFGATLFTMPLDCELVATREFAAPRELVWEAFTSEEHLPHWMLGTEGSSLTVRENDLRPGGKWHFVWQEADGSQMEMRGEYLEVAPPERLVNTENWGEEWPEARNTMVLTEQDGRTQTVTTVVYASPEAREKAIGTGMLEGWAAAFDRLEAYLGELQEERKREAA